MPASSRRAALGCFGLGAFLSFADFFSALSFFFAALLGFGGLFPMTHLLRIAVAGINIS